MAEALLYAHPRMGSHEFAPVSHRLQPRACPVPSDVGSASACFPAIDGVRSPNIKDTFVMLDVSHLKHFRPLIVTPTHSHSVFVNYFQSVLTLINDARQFEMPVCIYTLAGESLVTRARNRCVAVFLDDPAWTHLVWVDADIGFRTEAFLRLLLSDRDIAAGIYPLKMEQWPVDGLSQGMNHREFVDRCARYTVNTGRPGDAVVRVDIEGDGFVQVREAPTGFMCIKRGVFDRMKIAYPELNYVSDTLGQEASRNFFSFFDTSIDPTTRRYLSEDYHFCRLWEAIGGTIHVDALSDLTHHGYKTYTGNFAESLKHSVAHAIGAPTGLRYEMSGLHHLERIPV
jgi:hypothetical protein